MSLVTATGQVGGGGGTVGAPQVGRMIRSSQKVFASEEHLMRWTDLFHTCWRRAPGYLGRGARTEEAFDWLRI